MNNDLDKFKYAQQVAFDCAKYTEQNLKEGMSEKDACDIMLSYLKKRDVNDFFHLPFAWFGERTAFKGFERPLSVTDAGAHLGQEFMPTDKKLEKGMCAILDVAPVVDGVIVDIGHSFSFGENKDVQKAKRDLLKFRDLILSGVQHKKLMSQIYHDCEKLLKELNYESGHAVYPLGVLGHKVGETTNKLPRINFRRFQLSAYSFLLKNKVNGLLKKDTSSGVWNSNSHTAITDGMWAVEPHIVTQSFGVKFEEILVVDNGKAFWLSEDLPHLNVA
jgi:Xaa-Pro aminopeptidase